MDSETKKYIRDEIAKQMNLILTALVGKNESVEKETIKDLFPGMEETQSRPVMHPYGFASKATADSMSVSARSGQHAGNRLVLGHRDKNRPDDISNGETVIYASDGKTVLRRIDVQKDKITIGSRDASEPLVLGNVQKEFQQKWLESWLNAPQIGVCAVGPVFLFPQIRQELTEYKETYISAEDTNIVSQENFTERKA